MDHLFSLTEDEIELKFVRVGLEHWIERIKQVLDLSDLTALQSASNDAKDKVMNLAEATIEKRALERVFEMLTPERDRQNVNLSQEAERWSVLVSDEGDKTLVSAIKDKISEEDKEVLKTLDQSEFENFLKKANHPELNRVLTEAFTDICGKDKKDPKPITDDASGVADAGPKSQKHEEEEDGHQGGNFEDAVGDVTEDTELRQENLTKALRQEVQAWFKKYEDINLQNVCTCIEDLLSLKKVSVDLWNKEVIYLREVQKRIISTASILIKMDDENVKKKISTSLGKILKSNVDRSYFPSIGYIMKIINGGEGNPFKVSNVKDLIDILQDEVSKTHDEKTLQSRLEATTKVLSFEPKKSYEYLVYIGVLQVFSLNTESFLFENDLKFKDIKAIHNILEKHTVNIEMLEGKEQKQAYVLDLALCSSSNRVVAVKYACDNMPEDLCGKIRSSSRSFTQLFDFEALKGVTSELLPICCPSDDLNTLVHSLKSQLYFPKRQKTFDVDDQDKTTDEHLDKSVEEMLMLLDMRKYYPQKLKLEDVQMLTASDYQIIQKPTTLAELPWYFIKHVIGLDSDVRENYDVATQEIRVDKGDNDSWSSSDSSDSIVHPLDLIYCIFLCADDFLRQELADKMTRCQYAVPFILPAPSKELPKNLILHWALKTITRTFYHNGQYAAKTLVDVEAPLVTFMNIGEETSWKSRLLNKMLSPQQETFWHQELRGGNQKQCVSHGMVEVAWYLPGGQKDDKYPHPVTFANVRGNAVNSDLSTQVLDSSFVTCFFVEDINEQLKKFLHGKSELENIIIALDGKENDKITERKVKRLRKEFKLGNDQIILRKTDSSDFNAIYERIKCCLSKVPSHGYQATTLSLAQIAFKHNDSNLLDNRMCYYGQQAAQSILKDIDGHDMNDRGTSANAEILSHQSNWQLRHKITALEKELCRLKNWEHNTPMEVYIHQIKDEKWKLKLKLLQKPVSSTFRYFLAYLTNSDDSDQKYFLRCLKLGLSEKLGDLLQPFQDEENKYLSEVASQDRDPNLMLTDENVRNASLDIEDFFRELGTMYEDILDLGKEGVCRDDIDEMLDVMSSIGTDLFMKGLAIELMDMDSAHVPVEWITAIVHKIENRSRQTVFKVSTLGGQIAGKSTILNSTFGLNFPVSTERSTRGSRMQLLRIDEVLKKKLKCTYIVVIDTEGLRPRVNQDNLEHSNELATFVIGLSDLTLEVVKGKENEMQNILPLAIHVFLRKNILGEHQACHFVHQNMGVNVRTKTEMMDEFVRDLDEMTLVAAKIADKEDQIKKFSDVLQYDPNHDITFAPSLWDGHLPMGKINPQYSKTMQQLKFNIMRHVEDMHVQAQKPVSTFEGFTKRLCGLWSAIKHENFIFSFMDARAIETYEKLNKIFNHQQWTVKKKVRQMIKREQVNIENASIRREVDKRELSEASRNKLLGYINDEITQLRDEFTHYFRCPGCEQCDTTVQNRHLLANKEGEFLNNMMTGLNKVLLRELEDSFEELMMKINVEEQINQFHSEIEDTIMSRAQQLMQEESSKSGEALEKFFQEIWIEETGSFKLVLPKSQEDKNIETAVQSTLKMVLEPSETHLYIEKMFKQSSHPGVFTVEKEKHMADRGTMKLGISRIATVLNEQDVNRLQEQSDSIIHDTSKYCDANLFPFGKRFCQSDAEDLFRDALHKIQDFYDWRFKTTNQYKIDILHFIETKAVSGFTKMHAKYVKENSPEALLESKRKACFVNFLVLVEYADVTSVFCNIVLKEIIFTNVDDKTSCSELHCLLLQHPNGIFRSSKHFQRHMKLELLKENTFEGFVRYIADYKAQAKLMLVNSVTQYFTHDDMLKNFAKSKLGEIMDEIKRALGNIMHVKSEEESFRNLFLTEMRSLKIPSIATFPCLELPMTVQMQCLINHQLDFLKADVMKTISSWDISRKLEERGLTEFLFKELIGCNARCPFCKVPCDAHSGSRTQGNHSAMLHRPQGLGGTMQTEKSELVSGDCSTRIASMDYFCHPKDRSNRIPYRHYRSLFPTWTIHPDPDPDAEKYWQFVFAKYNEQFALHYNAKPAKIPIQWTTLTREEVMEDIEVRYPS